MSTVSATQIIYTRVERDLSPRRVGGFQTVLCTQEALSADLVEEAEHYFATGGATSAGSNLVFGPVGDGKLLLAQLTPVTDLDRCGRGGNFIAHALVFSREEFLALGGNPIAIARQVPFATSLDDALSRGDGKTGNISRLELTLGGAMANKASLGEVWSRKNLTNLLVFAACEGRLTGRGGAVAIIGSADDIAGTLELVFSLMPEALRCRLSFDSSGSGSNRNVSLWASGYGEAPSRGPLYRVDAQDKTADQFDDEDLRSSFANWLDLRLQERVDTELAKVAEAAWPLCQLIDNENSLGTSMFGRIEPRLAEQVWRAGRKRAESQLFRVLGEHAGRILAGRVIGWFLAHHEPDALLRYLVKMDEKQIVRGLCAEYSKLQEPPSDDEQNELEELACRGGDNRLSVWLAAWRGDWTDLREHLKRLTDEEYRRAAEGLLILKGLKPERLYLRRRGTLLAEAMADYARRESSIDIHGIVRRLVSEGEVDALVSLQSLLPEQPRATLVGLSRYLQKADVAVPATFNQALAHALEEKKPSGSWLRRIMSRATSRSRRP